MTWNHRVVKHDDVFGIKEVYYDETGKIVSWTQDFIAPIGESFNELKQSISMYQRALKQPILFETGDQMIELGRVI